MKYLPNLISLSRIVLSIVLLFFFNELSTFVIIYFLCGVSDVLDGTIARWTNTKSDLGAKLDSIADFIFFGIMIVWIIWFFGNDLREYYLFLAVILLIRIGGLLLAFFKYRVFLMLHTWGNKITGVFVFFTPIFLLFQNNTIIYLVITIAVLAAIEEVVIHIISKQPDPDRKGLFF
jgi:CDP-diacylglycerol--glycerol-3-phosphate 3-phosphatidyltransferase